MTPLALPRDYHRIKLVQSFEELIAMDFADGINAICWQRELSGDFGEVVEKLAAGDGITTLDDELLLSLSVSAEGQRAIGILLEDQQRLRERELEPVLNCICGYPRDEHPGPVITDVFSFHADSAPVKAETWLCTYHGPASELLRNDQAQRRVDVPQTRDELLKDYGGEDDEGFAEYLSENCYDLHYAPLSGAQPIAFGIGNLWRIAVEYPASPVPPCIHRAPETQDDTPPRLLLIS